MLQSSPSSTRGGGDAGGPESDESENAIEKRPPWHWVGFGTIATFALWLPLAYVAEAVRHSLFISRFGPTATQEEVRAAFATMADGQRFRWIAVQTVPHLVAFALGAFAGGLLVGRFGAGAGPREAALSGALTACVAVGVAWRAVAEGGWGAVVAIVVPVFVAVAFASWGGVSGAKKKNRDLT